MPRDNRPTKHNKNTKRLAARIYSRITLVELKQLREQAQIAGLTVSNYVRRRALGHRVVADVDLLMIREVRRVGGLLKLVHNESGGAYSEATAAGLDAVQVCIKAAARSYEAGASRRRARVAG